MATSPLWTATLFGTPVSVKIWPTFTGAAGFAMSMTSTCVGTLVEFTLKRRFERLSYAEISIAPPAFLY